MIPTLVLDRSVAGAWSDVQSAINLARTLGRPAFVSRIEPLPHVPDPIAFLRAASRHLGHGVLWEQSAAGIAFAGAGAAATLQANGSSRFGAVSSGIAELSALLVRNDTEFFPLIGGFGFTSGQKKPSKWDPFPDALLSIPRVLVQMVAGSASLRVTSPVDPNASPAAVDAAMRQAFDWARKWTIEDLPSPRQPALIGRASIPERLAWESSVAAAVSRIDRDRLTKVVLAREERLLFDNVVSPVFALARMREYDPAATRFAIQSAGAWFIGSTPERLVRLMRGQVDVTCLAGSIAIGRHTEETETLASELLASAKDREEHDIVVRSTIQALKEICQDVSVAPGSPRVVQARSVQHLQTPISARLPRAGRIIDLVERLHPTPAVGGYPRGLALAAIRELESIDRGWYAAPFGWTDLDGDGEFAVAIRSALLSGRAASLFAGCGIVAGSVPSAEWDETVLKLRPMLSALEAS